MLLNGLSWLERQEKKPARLFSSFIRQIFAVFLFFFTFHFILWLCAIGRFSLCLISRFPFDDYCHPAAALDVGTQNKHFSNGYISLCAKRSKGEKATEWREGESEMEWECKQIDKRMYCLCLWYFQSNEIFFLVLLLISFVEITFNAIHKRRLIQWQSASHPKSISITFLIRIFPAARTPHLHRLL